MYFFWLTPKKNKVHNGLPHDSNFGYSYAKRLIDVLNRGYYEQHNRLFTSIVPCNIYGPNDNFNPTASHVIPGMIQRLYKIINDPTATTPQEERVFTVYGTGKPLRQFIYSHDLARLAIWVLREYKSISPIILSGKRNNKQINIPTHCVLLPFYFQLMKMTRCPLNL